jgi:two-component system, NtrC family, response regulator AtoC
MDYGNSVLIVDDEEQLCRIIAHKLNKAGFRTYQAHNGQSALNMVKKEEIDVVILDYMLSDMTGIDVLQKIKEENEQISIIMLTAYGNIENAVKAMKMGAFDYVNKPAELEILQEIVKKACQNKQIRLENQVLKEEIERTTSYDDLIFQSEKMKSIVQLLEKVTLTSASILILGESGVGKTALAKWIHKHSPRGQKPFVSINCAAIPESLLESELFGYKKGAFTGATETRSGKFETADGGTIFLDEIGELSPAVQAKLLHVIEEKSFMKLGSNAYRQVDVRIITATNRKIRKMVKEGTFREDLYYRLNLVEVEVPPLRERKEDIPYLIEHHLRKLNQKYHKQLTISESLVRKMSIYNWPGNIREMYNLMERFHILLENGEIQLNDALHHLFFEPDIDQINRHNETDQLFIEKDKLENVLNMVEEQMIRNALSQTGGNQTKAAEMLGISRHALIYKTKKIHHH